MIYKSGYKCFWHISALLVMIVIFLFSSQSGQQSSGVSSGLTALFIDVLDSDYVQLLQSMNISPYASIELFFRKCAHFCEYALLSFCVFNALCYYTRNTEYLLMFSIVISFVYSVSDELHQYFVPERSCSVIDVLIDTSGIITGVLTAMLICRIIALLKYKNIMEV